MNRFAADGNRKLNGSKHPCTISLQIRKTAEFIFFHVRCLAWRSAVALFAYIPDGASVRRNTTVSQQGRVKL